MTATNTAASQDDADEFAGELRKLISGVFTLGNPPPVRAIARGSRYLVIPIKDENRAAGGERLEADPIALHVNGNPVAQLLLTWMLEFDHTGNYFAVQSSRFHVISTKSTEVLYRFEYVRRVADHDEMPPPCAHWHVHAESGAISQMRTLAGIPASHDSASVHIPVGGHRYRPGVEDFIEFVVKELGVDHNPGWREAVNRSRANWRRMQLASSVRDAPEEAARVLRDLNYQVTPPSPAPQERLEQLQRY